MIKVSGVMAVSGAIGLSLNNNECRETSTCPILFSKGDHVEIYKLDCKEV